jgi:hypothetical protein
MRDPDRIGYGPCESIERYTVRQLTDTGMSACT